MEFLIDLITLLFFVLIVSIPFINNVFISKYLDFSISNFILILIINFILSSILTLFFTYWSSELSQTILLNFYGFNENGEGEIECFKNVASENITRVKEIYESRMGIGWPLKVFFGLIIVMPYTILVTFILGFINYKKYYLT